MSKAQFLEMTLRDSTKLSQVSLFEAYLKWIELNPQCAVDKDEIFSKLDYSRMTPEQLLNTVKPAKVVSADQTLQAIEENNLIRIKDLNLAMDETAKLIREENCILVDLGKIYFINFIQLDLDEFSRSYHIELSANSQDWVCPIDFSKSAHYFIQDLYFPETAVLLIKIVGHGTTLPVREVEYNDKPKLVCVTQNNAQIPKAVNGYVYPKENVVTNSFSYTVDALKNWDPRNSLLDCYEDKGHANTFTVTCIENGEFEIVFHQPYILDSCRFLLWLFDLTQIIFH